MPTAPNTVSAGVDRKNYAGGSADRIFYDGVCGLCQGYIRFLIRWDRAGDKFRYASLQGTTFEALIPPDRRRSLPDSLVVLTNDGRLLIRFVAGAISAIPRPIRDAVYNFVARIRYRVFGKRKNVCPVTPPDLRARFDD
jgi:predicted DCC family thiol-disulfide oxidoreductase YuxK